MEMPGATVVNFTRFFLEFLETWRGLLCFMLSNMETGRNNGVSKIQKQFHQSTKGI